MYRLVGLLRAHGLVEQAGDGRYQLGPKAIMIGYVARSPVDLADVWRPGLQKLALASRETAPVLRRIEDSAVPEYRLEPGRRSEIIALTRDVAAELRGKLSHYA